MEHLQVVTDPSEVVLWEGNWTFQRVLMFCLIPGLSASSAVLAAEGLGYLPQAIASNLILVLNILVIMLAVMALIAIERVNFYITNRRIVRTWEFLYWRKQWDLPLQAVSEVVLKRSRGKDFVIFVPSSGYRGIEFGPVKYKPEWVREIALRARSELKIG